MDQAQPFLQSAGLEEPAAVTRIADRANLADASPLEMAFEEHFANVYGSMAMPCSLHSVFQNPFYVPFSDVLRRDYKPGD